MHGQTNIKFINTCSTGAEMFHADRQTDMTQLIVAFRKFQIRKRA